MNATSNSPPPLLAQRWAFRFGFALLAGMTIVVGLAFSDHARRGRLESTSETTAVSDAKYFKMPASAQALPVKAATLNGRPLTVAALEKIEVRDTHLRRVAVDAAGWLSIYELSAAATNEERERAGGRAYLLKLAPGEYVKAHAVGP
jgi:hypothetical protein